MRADTHMLQPFPLPLYWQARATAVNSAAGAETAGELQPRKS